MNGLKYNEILDKEDSNNPLKPIYDRSLVLF